MKKKVLVSSVLVIALCLCIIVGSTFALFTSKTALNVAVTAGNVKVVATLQENSLKAYSGEWDDAAKDYASVEVSANEALSKVFANGGTVVADTATNEIKIDKITPMDKVEFTIDVTNYSDVTIKYRTVITTDAAATNDGVTLLDALEITIDGADTMGQVDANTKASAWAVWAPAADVAAGETKSINVVIEFPNGTPEHDNMFQGLAAALTYTVEAVQGNGHTVDDIATILASTAAGGTATLPADDYGVVTLNGSYNDITIAAEDGATFDKIVIGANASLTDVTFEGFDFTYDGAADMGFVIDANATIDNLVIDGCTFTGTGAKAGRGISGFNNNASITLTGCEFKDLGYPIYAWGGYESLTVEGCTFTNIKSWAVMPQSGFDGDLTVTGCTFKDCLGGGLVKAGTLTAGHTFTFTDNVITGCTIAGDHNWFQFNVSAGTAVISGNTKDGADWVPTTADGLK